MGHIKGTTKNGTNWNVGRETTSLGDFLMDVTRAIAIGISWKANASILWAILHTLLGPFYVVWNLIMIRNLF